MRPPARRRTLSVVALMLFVIASPLVAAEADVTLTSDSSSKEASPGTPAEYTITVRNTGDEDITVQLATSQEAGGCQGYTSAIEQVSGPISPQATEQVTLCLLYTSDAADE